MSTLSGSMSVPLSSTLSSSSLPLSQSTPVHRITSVVLNGMLHEGTPLNSTWGASARPTTFLVYMEPVADDPKCPW